MSEHSVVDAKNGLPALIDKARAGEQVIITRHGRPVAELRAVNGRPSGRPSHYSLLKRERDARKAVDIGSVELLRRMYDEA